MAVFDYDHYETGKGERKAIELAMSNCQRVAEKLGAELSFDCSRATISIGPYSYWVTPCWVSRWLSTYPLGRDGTCILHHSVPYPEQVATLLLLLKNDPTIFDRWKARDGWYA